MTLDNINDGKKSIIKEILKELVSLKHTSCSKIKI